MTTRVLFKNSEIILRVLDEITSKEVINLDSDLVSRCLLNYLRLVDKCYTLESSRVSEGVKGAWHHILPRSLYPEYEKAIPPLRSNWNEVLMTHKEHFVAHHLLYEIYGRSGPMQNAFRRMIYGNSNTSEFRKASLERSLKNSNHRHSEETKKKIGDSSRGRTHSDESKKKLSDSLKGRKLSEGHLEKLRIANSRPRTYTDDIRENMSKAQRGKKASEETRRKMSEARLGKKLVKRTGFKIRRREVKCTHCLKVSTSAANMIRYHFDNCRFNFSDSNWYKKLDSNFRIGPV